jgi:hypothetical protein
MDCKKKGRYQSLKTSTIYDRSRSIDELKKIIPSFLYNGYKKIEVYHKTGIK